MHKNIVCPGCTCLCDDINLSFNGEQLVTQHACELGQRWYTQPRVTESRFLVDGQPTSVERAIAAASQQLSHSLAPLICGLDHLTTEAQQAAWKLADKVGGTIDTTFTNQQRAGQFSLQRVGRVAATLGEVAQRSDFVVFWFCDPAKTHPRHLERYSRPHKGSQRTIIVVDDQQSASAGQADDFILLPKEAAAALLTTLRAIIAGVDIDERAVLDSTGLAFTQCQHLANQLLAARYGTFFFGPTTTESQFDLAADSLAMLVRELNDKTRFVAISLRSDANTLSAENVLAWSSGYSFALNLSRRFPRSSWLEYSASTLLSRGECDLIFVGSSGSLDSSLAALEPIARKHFEATPKIIIGESPYGELPNTPVQFMVGQPGKSDSGDFCRQDDVAMPLFSLFPGSNCVSADWVFRELLGSTS